MADRDEARLKLEFEDTGETFDNATEFSIQSAFMVDSDAWSATFANENDPVKLRRTFQIGRPIKLYLGDRLQLIGRIGHTNGLGGRSGGLQVSGRDYFADLVDPSIDPTVRINSEMSLSDALLAGLGVFGITEVESDLEAVTSGKMGQRQFKTELQPAAFQAYAESFDLDTAAIARSAFVERKIAVAAPVPDLKPAKGGEGALQWAKRLAARSGFTVQPGSKRSAIAVVAPDYASPPRYRFTNPGNVEESTANRNGDDMPTFVNMSARLVNKKTQQVPGKSEGFSVSGSDSPSALRNTEEGRRFIAASGMVDRRLRPGEKNKLPNLYKPTYFADDRAKTQDQLLRSARRMMAEKTKRFFQYSATVYSHNDSDTGATYATNAMAEVLDGVEDVAEALWISETNLTFNGSGKTADISMLLPGSYIL